MRPVPESGRAACRLSCRRSSMTKSNRPPADPPEADRPGAEDHPEKAPEGQAPARADVLPVLPLRDIVVFPHMIVPLFVGREKSVRALEAVMKDDKQILLVAQKNAAQDDPSAEDIYRVGTVSTILQLLKLPDGTVKVLVEGGRRAQDRRVQGNRGLFRGLRRADAGQRDRGQGARGARPHGDRPVRAVHQAQQEDRARSAGLAQPDRGALASSPTRWPAIST